MTILYNQSTESTFGEHALLSFIYNYTMLKVYARLSEVT